MDELTLHLPESIVGALPEDGEPAAKDMERAVGGWERQFNELLADEPELDAVVDLLERLEGRWERYDAFVVELRAWGQSPIYAMAWRDLIGTVIRQVHDHADLADRIDRERHARIVEDGIRRQG
ncbi:MAG: hypothetical protein U5J98_10485 [Halobacteriales archaeon]|nr:hypothetical protein [Halobacteriales archaeon]